MTQTATTLEEDVHAYATLSRDALADRWRIYARLRDEAPAYPFANSILVTRHADCVALLLDRERVHNNGPSHGVPPEVLARLTAGERAMLGDIIDWEERWLTSVNGDRHADLRGLGQRVFAPRAIVEIRERTEEIAEAMLGSLAGRPEVEFIDEFAYKLPLAVISEILDIPEEMREPLHETTNGMRVARTGLAWRMQLPHGLEEAHGHFMEMKRQILELFELRRGTRTTTIMGNILDALADGADEDDIVVLTQLLITAGHRTTTDLLGSAMHTLLTHRDEWERVCADPALVRQTIEEVLRYRSPAQDVERFATADFDLHGVHVRRGQHLTITVGAANHDEDVFHEPERFDIDRDDVKAHLAFGRGPHFCLGNALTRLEGDVVLRAIARRFPDAELVEPEPEWMPNTHLLGLSRLPLRLGTDRG
jgi:cytochrome P450